MTSIQKKNMDRDENLDIFEKCMGSFGRYQWWLSFLIYLCKFPIGWHMLNYIIIAPRPQLICANDRNLTDVCNNPNCEKIIIDPEPFSNTILTQWNLGCGDRMLVDLAQMLLMLGTLVGSFFFGMMGDKFGRRLPFVIAITAQATFGTAIAFVPWYWLFLLMRFIIGLTVGGTMTLSFVLLAELIGKKWRVVISTMYQTPTWLGHLSLALIGYYLRDWRQSQILVGALPFILISYYWLLPESPRYLLSVGRTDEAIKTMTLIAKMNGLPHENIENDVKAYLALASSQNNNKNKGKLVDIFTPKKILMRTLICSLNWITAGLVFYGVAQYASQTGGNIFMNIAMSAAMEVPGTIAATIFLIKIGRKYTSITACLVAGISLLAIPFFETGSIWIPTMALIALFATAGFFATIYVYSGELYPTYIRGLGVGFVGTMCRVGTILAPFVASLAQYDVAKWLPPVIFGMLPLLSAASTFYLPETKNEQLPNSLEDALSLGQKKNKENT